MDELAHAAGKDPVEYRRALLGNNPRSLALLDLAAAKIGWGSGLAAAARRTRRRAGLAVRQPHLRDRGSAGHAAGRGAAAPRGRRARLRHRDQSEFRRGAGPGRPAVRSERRALQRHHARRTAPSSRATFTTTAILRMNEAPLIEVYRIESNGAAGRPRRSGHRHRGARPRQCHLRGHRRAPALSAHRPQPLGRKCRALKIRRRGLRAHGSSSRDGEPYEATGHHRRRAGRDRRDRRTALEPHRSRRRAPRPAIAGAPPSGRGVARGEYLTKAADCIACHTVPESGKPFAGGVAFKLPFGTIYSTNITADPNYGIGAYSDEEFVRAVREGVRRDGKHLYPAFPYTSYTQLSRDDVLAIKAYLMTLPADRRSPIGPTSSAFRSISAGRWLFWNAAFFKSAPLCAGPCEAGAMEQRRLSRHRARPLRRVPHAAQLGFGLEHGRELAGEELQGWRAYNITSDPQHGIGAWSRRSKSSPISPRGHAPRTCLGRRPHGRGGRAQPAIPERRRRGRAGDLSAHRTGARGQASRSRSMRSRPRSAHRTPCCPVRTSCVSESQGSQLFEGACASCHQWNGPGRETPYASLQGTRGVNDAARR